MLWEAALAKSVEVRDLFGSGLEPHKHPENTNLGLHVGMDTVTPSNVVCDLGVLLDSELTMRQQISKIVGVFLPSSMS